MAAIILDGKNLAHICEDSIKNEVSDLKNKGINPTLATILVVTNPQSIKTLRPLISSTESAIISPAVAFVNESR